MNAVLKIGNTEYEPARFDRELILAAAESGFFHRLGRVEVIDGVLVRMSPSYLPHGAALMKTGAALLSRLPEPLTVTSDTIVLFGTEGMRAPDIAVVDRALDADILEPGDLHLAIEIADSSLGYDLGDKARFYAAHGIAEYWVIDLTGQRTVCHRDPASEGYADVRDVPWTSAISPGAAPEVSLTFSELLED
jgi:Uma2 family endonuclease